MKNLLYSLILTISLSGCITSGLPSGIANNGCGNNCQSKDYTPTISGSRRPLIVYHSLKTHILAF
jgi:hypothetical protein